MQSANNLHQIALAILQYQDTYGHLPPAAVRGKDGRPLLSWRVVILPFLDQAGLYAEFHLDESWDSPHNQRLSKKMPRAYAPVAGRDSVAPDSTFYQVFTGDGTSFETNGLVMPKDFPDGLANTILVVEAGHAVPWTKPADLLYLSERPLPELGGLFKGPTRFSNWNQIPGMNVAFADGSVQFLRHPIQEEILRGMITRNGGEPVSRENRMD
jgi:prepilin-type processing-associated H-X9-DG protein